MTYLEKFADDLREKLEGALAQEDIEEVVEFAISTCRESWKNGLEAGKKRSQNSKAPAEKRAPKKHYQHNH